MRRTLAFVLFTAASMMAQDHPNYSGTWKLSLDESDFAGKSGPKSKTEKIDQTGSGITETVSQVTGDDVQTGVFHYTTDGHASTNTAMGTQTESTAKWDGQDLVMHTTVHGKPDEAFDDRWTLSLDGSILTVRRHYEAQGMRSDQMLVYHKSAKTE